MLVTWTLSVLGLTNRSDAESRQLAVSIAVLDESTYLQHLLRMDGAPYLSAEGAV